MVGVRRGVIVVGDFGGSGILKGRVIMGRAGSMAIHWGSSCFPLRIVGYC